MLKMQESRGGVGVGWRSGEEGAGVGGELPYERSGMLVGNFCFDP